MSRDSTEFVPDEDVVLYTVYLIDGTTDTMERTVRSSYSGNAGYYLANMRELERGIVTANAAYPPHQVKKITWKIIKKITTYVQR